MRHPDEYRDMGVDEQHIQTEMLYTIAYAMEKQADMAERQADALVTIAKGDHR